MKNTECTFYNYKSFKIWSGDGETWIASPTWITDANAQYDFQVQHDCDYFKTINQAKKWVNEFIKSSSLESMAAEIKKAISKRDFDKVNNITSDLNKYYK